MLIFTIGLFTFIIFLLVLAITSMPILVLLRDNERAKSVILILGVEVFLSLIGFYIMYISTFASRDFASGGDQLLYNLNSFNNPNTNISLNPNTTSLYFNLYTFIGLYGISNLIGLFLKLSVRIKR